MSKASEAALGALHAAVAEGLAKAVSEGVPVVVSEKDADGEKVTRLEYAPAGAAYYAAAIALLKNNGITADPEANEGLSELRKTLQAKRDAAKAGMKTGAGSAALDEAAAMFAQHHPIQ